MERCVGAVVYLILYECFFAFFDLLVMPLGMHVVSVRAVCAFDEERRRFCRLVVLVDLNLDRFTVDFSYFPRILCPFPG